MFSPSARVDSCMYILGKKKEEHSTFIRLSDVYEGIRKTEYDKIYKDSANYIRLNNHSFYFKSF